MNALAIHLYPIITFINLVIIRLALNYRTIVDTRLEFDKYKNDFKSDIIVAVLRIKLDHLRKQWRLEREALETPDFMRWIKCDWSTVHDSLQSNEIAIEFFTTQRDEIETYYAAIINKKSTKPKIVKLFDASSIPDLTTDMPYRDKRFSRNVWGKLQDSFSNCDCIYYSPDGRLYDIAIEHLQSPAGNKNNQCLADKYKIMRVSSTRELTSGRNDKNTTKPRVAFFSNIDYDRSSDMEEDFPNGNFDTEMSENRGSLITCIKTKGKFRPLVISADGIDLISIARKNGIQYELYDKTSATNQAFKKLSDKDFNVIHFSTHGFYIPVDSIYHNVAYRNLPFVRFSSDISSEDLSMNSCGLALSGANGIFGKEVPDSVGNGIMTASEISAVNLSKIDFIFLSACQTGLGHISSEGVYGLQRGFKIAGVKSLLYTLWDVNDDACDMFEKEFYTNYFAGKSKYDSFVAARNKLRSFTGVYNGHSYDFSRPKYWAGFVLHDGL